jgi:hypothetical protein
MSLFLMARLCGVGSVSAPKYELSSTVSAFCGAVPMMTLSGTWNVIQWRRILAAAASRSAREFA